MISAREIRARADEWGLREEIVEKDYVLGWLLWGIGSDESLRNGWVFKGGTCLKKCYMETFRFSEDLDFTHLDGGPSECDEVKKIVGNVLRRVNDACGIDFTVMDNRFEVTRSGNIKGRIYYRGPRGAPTPSRVLVDLTLGEKVVRPVVRRPIRHLYPDDLPAPADVPCYALEELFAEKLRAMGERGRPRDLYDIVYLREQSELYEQAYVIQRVLVEKCASKGVEVPTLEVLLDPQRLAELKSEWENMLGHQLPALPQLEHYLGQLDELFAWLKGAEIRKELGAATFGSEGETAWVPTRSSWSAGGGQPLEVIRFAGANRLCVDLGYQGRVRRIEPYSLRLTQAGDLLLYAVKRATGELRSYRVDRIQSASMTDEGFAPRYLVEFGAVAGD